MGLNVTRVYRDICRILLAVTAVNPPTNSALKYMHIVNLINRTVLLCVGVALISTQGTQCVYGLVTLPYATSLWENITDSHGDYPRLQEFAIPGNKLLVSVWFGIVVSLFINDVVRCMLVLSGRWGMAGNHMDASWVFISCVLIPLLFMCVAMLLGTHDWIMLCLIFVIANYSAICGTITEHLRGCVNPFATGVSDTIYILRVVQDGTLLVVTEVVLIPFVLNIMYLHETVSNVQIVIASLFFALVLAVWTTSYRHSVSCNQLEDTYPTKQSVLPWGTPDTVIPPNGIPPTFATDAVLIPRDSSDEYRIVKVQLGYESEFATTMPFEPIIVVEDGDMAMRAVIGQTTEWRRYYAINTLIDAILAVTIVAMTGLMESCDEAISTV
jgi:hypothetical protein